MSTEQKNWEQALEELSAQYAELEQDAPPELIDQAVINRARLAVEGSPGKRNVMSITRWMAFSATAMVAILAIGNVMRMQMPQTGQSPPARQEIDHTPISIKEETSIRVLGAEERAKALQSISADELSEAEADTEISQPRPAEPKKNRANAAKAQPTAAPPAMAKRSRERAVTSAANTTGVEQFDNNATNEPQLERADTRDQSLRQTEVQAALQPERNSFIDADPLPLAETWLALIEQLQQQLAADNSALNRARLTAEIEAFQAAYPDHLLPEPQPAEPEH